MEPISLLFECKGSCFPQSKATVRGVHRVLLGEPEGKNHWGDPDVDGRIIFGGIFRKLEGVVGTGWSGLRIGTGDGHL
jgi:hypothetical protein